MIIFYSSRTVFISERFRMIRGTFHLRDPWKKNVEISFPYPLTFLFLILHRFFLLTGAYRLHLHERMIADGSSPQATPGLLGPEYRLLNLENVFSCPFLIPS